MRECKYYHTKPKRVHLYNIFNGDPISFDVEVGVCSGTRECDECKCEGDTRKCDFYPQKRTEEIKPIETEKTGIWLINPDGYYPYCSECGYEPPYVSGKDMRTPYCPHCGTRMKKECE